MKMAAKTQRVAKIAKPMSRHTKSSNVQIRLHRSQKSIIQMAAHIENTTMSNFMVEQAYSAAQEVIADQSEYSLSKKKWKEFCEVLDRKERNIPALSKLLNQPSVFEKESETSSTQVD